MRQRLTPAFGLGLGLVLILIPVAGAVSRAAEPERQFTTVFPVDAQDWASKGSNPFFVLEPGWRLEYEGVEDGKKVHLTITVLDETKKIDGVETRVVEEKEVEDGETQEISRNYFAISKRTNSVYYFGEDVDVYEGGKIVGHDGAWRSGEEGAKYGLIMPGTALLGSRYFQEQAPGIAMDRAEVLGLTQTVETPAGKFQNCLETEETSPLEKGSSRKVYARGVGLLRDGPLLLVRHGPAGK
jgi:hypothetical protein